MVTNPVFDAPTVPSLATPTPSVYLAIDDVGHEILALIRPMIDRNPDLAALTVAASLPLDAEDTWPADAAAKIDDLLALPALQRHREIVVPGLWIAYDLDGPLATTAPRALAALLERFARQRVRLRLTLIVSSSAMEDETHPPLGATEIVEHLIAPGRPGHGITTVLAISDRDRANRRYDRATGVIGAAHFISFAFATGLTGAKHEALRNAFGPGVLTPLGSDAWTDVPAFGTFAARALVAHGTDRDALLLPPLAAAMTEPVTPDWLPRAPAAPVVDTPSRAPWSPLSPPVWQPSLWSPIGNERQRLRNVVGKWIARSNKWAHGERATFAAKVDALAAAYDDQRLAYQRRYLDEVDEIFADDGLAGYCSLLDRYLARCAGALAIETTADDNPATTDDGADSPPLIHDPEAEIVATTRPLLSLIERRLNGRLLLVTLLTTLLAVWVIPSLSLRFATDSAVSTPTWLPNEWQPLTWLPTLIDHVLSTSRRLLLVAQGALTLFLVGLSWLLVLRERGRLEAAFASVNRRARTWTRDATTALGETLAVQSAAIRRRHLNELRAEIEIDQQRVTALRERLDQRLRASRDGDRDLPRDRFTETVPLRHDLTPIPPFDAQEIVRAFRRTPMADWRRRSPDAVINDLMTFTENTLNIPLTGSIGDPEAFSAALAGVTPDHLDVMSPVTSRPDRSLNWRTTSIVAVPASLPSSLGSAGFDALLVPTTLDDRAIAVVLIQGMSASDLFGSPDHATHRD